MDFFNKAKEKLTKTSNDVAQKAKELAEIAKLNSQVASNESVIKATYAEIGKYVYENLKEDAPAEIAEKMATIDTALADIANLKAEILKLKGSQKCPQCESEVAQGVAFCPNCGNKMPEPVVDVVEEGEVKEVVEETAECAEEKVEAVAEAVEEKIESVVDAVEEKVEEVVENIQ